jgi:centrosomal protein CEP57
MNSETQTDPKNTEGVSSIPVLQDMAEDDDHAGDESVDPSMLSLRQHPSEFGIEFSPADEVMGSDRAKPSVPSRSVEDTQSEAVVAAIKALQDKIRKLEVERTRAADRFKQLEVDVQQYHSTSQRKNQGQKQRETTLERDKEAVNDQLQSAESRCKLLEKQLDYMRKMVHNAESDRSHAMEEMKRLQTQAKSKRVHGALDQEKLEGLEKQHLKLSASQALAESRIRDLEGKLEEERHKRKSLQQHSAKIDPDRPQSTGRKQLRSKTRSKSDSTDKASNSSRKVVTIKTDVQTKCCCTGIPEIPFVAGTSATPSHSVRGNIQQALALMKHYHPARVSRQSVQQPSSDRRRCSVKSQRKPRPVTASELSAVIGDLTDEFGALQHEYNDIARRIQGRTSSGSSLELNFDHLQQCMDDIVSRMESKSHSIQLLKQHKEQLLQDTKPWRETGQRGAKSVKRTFTLEGPGEVRVVTTVKSDDKGGMDPRVAKPKRNLQILKGMKTLQSQLQRDDLSWD